MSAQLLWRRDKLALDNQMESRGQDLLINTVYCLSGSYRAEKSRPATRCNTDSYAVPYQRFPPSYE